MPTSVEESSSLPLDQIVCGDNVAVLSTFPDACIDLVVTSPPYDNLRLYGGHTWDVEGVAQQLWRVIKPGGVVVWVVADATVDGSETGTSFRQALRFMEIGFRLHDTMIWQKTTFSMPCVSRYHNVWEYCFVFAKGGAQVFNPIEDRRNTSSGRTTAVTVRESDDSITQRSDKTIKEYGKRWNIWICDSARNDIDNGNHPAPFPEALARDHILSWSNEKEIVLDPFNGSGTTTKMARETGRRYIGIEVNPDYCKIAETRLAQQLLF